MQSRFTVPILLVSALALLGLIACTAPAAQDPEASPPSSASEAMATRAPAVEPPPLADFNEQRQTIDEAWDLVHDDFDQWRADLAMCHPTTMTEALSEFAIEFNDVTEEARDLTRTKTTGEFADKVITAAEDEETAFRQLRDRWQPGNVSLFENVEKQRNLAAQAQREAKDLALERRAALEDAADPEEIGEFTAAFEAIEQDLEDAHSEYNKLSDGADDDEVAEPVAGLKALAKEIDEIVAAIDELPPLKGGKDTIRALEKAVAAEVDALEAAVEEGEESVDAAAEDEDKEAKLPSFKKIDASVKATEEASENLADVVDDLSVEDTADALADVTMFELEYDRLLQSWDRFHSGYNSWRADDGGCDRLEVLESLTEFSSQVDAVGDSVRGLPKSGHLEPAHRLLVEAIKGEEQAFRSLRDTWQPFTLDALRAVDRARIMSDTRRSDADIIIMELENRF